METINCRNCGAPRNGKCDYCGTTYYSTIVNKNTNQTWDSLSPKQKTLLAIFLVVAPFHFYRKHLK